MDLGRQRVRRCPPRPDTRRRRVMIREFLAAAMMAISALSPSQAAAQHEPSNADIAREEYRIGPEDTLQISVWKNEPLSKTVPVRPDGMISLPLLQEIKVA